MTNKEFIKYVQEKKRQGVSESQIARSLGMSLAHFLGKLNEAEKDLGAAVVETKVESKPVVKEGPKPGSGFGSTEEVKGPFPGSKEPEQKPQRPKKDKVKKQPAEEPKPEEDLSWMD